MFSTIRPPPSLRSLVSSITSPSQVSKVVAEFQKANTEMTTIEGQTSCLELLKKLKQMRVQDKSLVSDLLVTMLKGNAGINILAPTYNIGRQMLIPSPAFYPPAESQFLSVLSGNPSLYFYEITQVMSGLGNVPMPLSPTQKALIALSGNYYLTHPQSIKKIKIYAIVIHTLAKVSYGSPDLIALLMEGLPSTIEALVAERNGHSLGVVLSSACRLKPNRDLVDKVVKPVVQQHRQDIGVKHLVNIMFYLSEKVYYSEQFFAEVMPEVEERVRTEGVSHFEVMLGATKGKLKAIEYHTKK